MSKSIMQTEKECYLCGAKIGLHEHHVLFGSANRKLSEKYGLKVYLCYMCHDKIHNDNELAVSLKRIAQRIFEKKYDHGKWMEVFGRNYL